VEVPFASLGCGFGTFRPFAGTCSESLTRRSWLAALRRINRKAVVVAEEKKLLKGQKEVAVVFSVVALACLVYLVLAVSGVIPEANRLKTADYAALIVACLFLTIVLYPTGLSRLSVFKFAGIELKIAELKERQIEQEEALETVFRILSPELSHYEKHHLKMIDREGDETAKGCENYRNELTRLLKLGLIEEVSGQTISSWLDGTEAKVRSMVRLTPIGKKFVVAMKKID
jgi:hypothetical protein